MERRKITFCPLIKADCKKEECVWYIKSQFHQTCAAYVIADSLWEINMWFTNQENLDPEKVIQKYMKLKD